MKVLVTGATGGIAPAVAMLFEEDGAYEVVRSGRGKRPSSGSYSQCDMSLAADVHAMIAKVRPHLVVHLAGSFQNTFQSDLAVNCLSAGWIAEALIANGTGGRLVLIGSAAEYGIVGPEDSPIREAHPLNPVSIYGLTKALQTEIGLYYARTSSIEVVVARLFNVYGFGLSSRLFVGRAQEQIEKFCRGEIDEIELGNLDAERDYISVEEAARQIKLVCERGCSGSVYNLGSGAPVRMRALLDRMLEAAGVPDAPIVQRPVLRRAAQVDVARIYADTSRICALERG